MIDTGPFRGWACTRLADVFDGTLMRPDDEIPVADASCEYVRSALAILDRVIHATAADVSAADHARLFVNAPGGVAAPPYASCYLDRRLLGTSAAWVATAYAAQGLEIARNAGEPPDYLPTELEYLYFLARHESAARQTADAVALRGALDARAHFMLHHFGVWVPAFLARLRAAAPGPVFAAAGDALAALLAVERTHVRPSATALPSADPSKIG